MQLIDMMLGYLCLFSDPEFQELRNGNPEELRKLYLHYKRPLINFLLIHLKGNKAVAEDILQETFEIVIESPGKMNSQKNLKRWLFRITYNRLLLYFRRMKYDNAKIRFLQDHLETIDDEPFEILEKKEKYFLFVCALDNIKSNYRDVITMKYFKGISQKEIAKSLEKTEGAVEQLLIRAKQAIKNEITILQNNYFKKGGITA